LKGNSALLTLPADWAASLSAFYKFAKGEGNITFKVGVIDDKVYDKNELVKLALLPSREELISKIIMSLKSPQTRLVYSMKYNMQKLAYILRNANKS
jgi:large subunit ribosomal protein L10